jgi:hypothetical protein
MLPALAGLLPAFTLESATVATAVSGFFTYLWKENIKNADSYDFSFDAELEKIPVEYTKLDNSIIEQTNSSVDNFQTALETYANGFQEKQEISVSNTTQQVQTKTSIIDVLKSSNIEMIEQQKILNNNLAKQNEILLKTLEAKGLEVINQNKLIAILSENLQSLNISVATLATLPKITATNSEYSLIMQSQIIEAIQNKEFKASINTDSITNAIKEIGLTQNAVNEKALEKLNKELEKDITFEGKTYSKVELEKLKDLEKLKNVKDENDTLLNDGLELYEAFISDGFDITANPLAFILGELQKEFSKDSADIKTKYSL